MIYVNENTLPEAYHRVMDAIAWHGHVSYNSDWLCNFIDSPFVMRVNEPLREPMISKCLYGTPYDLERYRLEMLDGILDFEVDSGKWAYTYHKRIVDQIPYVVQELKRNPASRRAVISVWNPSIDKDISDPPCLQHIQYFIRNGALHCHVMFRSNDIVKGLFMNAFALIMLQKRIADELGMAVGTYTHAANNGHVYQRDWPLLESFEHRYNDPVTRESLTYCYHGEWDEYMDEARPKIFEEVERLKSQILRKS